jgi:hypothetical protein
LDGLGWLRVSWKLKLGVFWLQAYPDTFKVFLWFILARLIPTFLFGAIVDFLLKRVA